MKIFNKDIKEAIIKARNDEREKCYKEMRNELIKQKIDLENEYTIKIKEKEAEIESIYLRINEIQKREKMIEDKRQKLRQTEIRIRRLLTDLKYLSDKKRDEDIERLQTLDRLVDEANIINKMLQGGAE